MQGRRCCCRCRQNSTSYKSDFYCLNLEDDLLEIDRIEKPTNPNQSLQPFPLAYRFIAIFCAQSIDSVDLSENRDDIYDNKREKVIDEVK